MSKGKLQISTLQIYCYSRLMKRVLIFSAPSGSGKTTIINLINRFYDIQEGAISIDGTNIKKYSLKALRDRIAMVLQDVFLFSGTVAPVCCPTYGNNTRNSKLSLYTKPFFSYEVIDDIR